MNGRNLSKVVHGGTGIRIKRKTGASILDFSASINPYPPHLESGITQEYLDVYPDDGYEELKSVIARHLGRDSDEVTVGNGSIEVIRVLCSTVLSPGDTISITRPTFGEYEFSAKLAGATPAAGPGSKIHFLCNPNNPTGYLMEKDEILRLLDRCSREGCILAIDEAFIEISDDPSHQVADISHPSLFVIRSLTKSYAVPGIRFGFGLGDPAIIEQMEMRRLPWSVNAIAEKMAIAAFTEHGDLSYSRKRIREERERVCTALADLPVEVIPSRTNFLLLNLDRDVAPLCEALLHKGILVRDCHSFGLPCSIRIAVRRREDNMRLVEALSECLH
ncbi:MAG: pyridoxal phosphate-dependent aminotransferase [Methanolinea sp.]|jgi:threonine-phosphate decarboxylase|nr:histidinol-phosphate aminotransferase family protein [Methanolinea sp.]